MKRFLFLSAFLFFFSLFAKGQARIGYTETQIRNEFYYYSFQTDYLPDGAKFIYSRDFYQATVSYFFDSNDICISTVIIPLNQGALNYYVELFNSMYVIISTTKWLAYTKDGILSIELVYEEDSYFFVIK